MPKGHIRVGFWVGICAGRGVGNAYTGWESMSRIVIEEVRLLKLSNTFH